MAAYDRRQSLGSQYPLHPLQARQHDDDDESGIGMEMEMQEHNRGKVGQGGVPDPGMFGEEGGDKRRGCNPFKAVMIVLRSSSRLGSYTNVGSFFVHLPFLELS